MGVVSRLRCVESMDVASGCGCKEVYIFPHITYPYSSVSVLFCSSIPTFCSFFIIEIRQDPTMLHLHVEDVESRQHCTCKAI